MNELKEVLIASGDKDKNATMVETFKKVDAMIMQKRKEVITIQQSMRAINCLVALVLAALSVASFPQPNK